MPTDSCKPTVYLFGSTSTISVSIITSSNSLLLCEKLIIPILTTKTITTPISIDLFNIC